MTNEITRTNIASGSPFEPLRGYSRAVRIGDHLFISGTTAMSPQGDVAAPGNAYEQTRVALNSIRSILTRSGFSIADVVRTRLFVTNIVNWDDYARAHGEVFDNVRPASSLVQVTKLVDPRLVVEIEVDAVRGAREVQDERVDIVT